MVARRAHNPEVERFKSLPRNQKEKVAQGATFFFCVVCDLNLSKASRREATGGRGLAPQESHSVAFREAVEPKRKAFERSCAS